jgi:hypothetical protein
MSDRESDVKNLNRSGVTIYPAQASRERSERGTRANEIEQDHYLMAQDFGSVGAGIGWTHFGRVNADPPSVPFCAGWP